MNLQNSDDCSLDIVSLWLLSIVDVNRKSPARYFKNWCAIKELAKLLSIQSSTRNQKFEIWSEPSYVFD